MGRVRIQNSRLYGAVRQLVCGLLLSLTVLSRYGAAGVELQISLVNAATLDLKRRQLLEEAIGQAKAMWEHVVLGHQTGVDVAAVVIDVRASLFLDGALATGGPTSTIDEGGFTLVKRGDIVVNLEQVEEYANWQGPGASGLNLLDELLAHEIGHVLGIGTLWNENGVYYDDVKYVGEHGLAALSGGVRPVGHVHSSRKRGRRLSPRPLESGVSQHDGGRKPQ